MRVSAICCGITFITSENLVLPTNITIAPGVMTWLDIEVVTQPKCVRVLKPTITVEVYASLDFIFNNCMRITCGILAIIIHKIK